MPYRAEKMASLQPHVGLLEDGDVGVGVFQSRDVTAAGPHGGADLESVDQIGDCQSSGLL
jgi:hypothetical protein